MTTVALRKRLTERELLVLQGMAEGKANAQIGRAMHISEDTVKTHGRHLFRKLGAPDRTAAVVRALQLGVLTLDGVAARQRSAPVHDGCGPHRGPGPSVILRPTEHDAALLARALAGGRVPHEAGQARALDALQRLAGTAVTG